MTSTDATLPVALPATGSIKEDRLRGGWRIVAGKELADHLQSVRFILLLLIVSLAGGAAVYSTAGDINEIIGSSPKDSSLFLLLFIGIPNGGSSIPSFVWFIGILGPLLGIMFGFDAIGGERARRTLPRLVAQPIYRYDVISGKFAAGIAAIALVLGTVTSAVMGIGMLRLGLVPSLADCARVAMYVFLSLLYIGVWLGLAILASLWVRDASTAALATLAVWIVLTLFLPLLTGWIANWRSKVSADPAREPERWAVETYDNEKYAYDLSRFSPYTQYEEAASVVLNPFRRSSSVYLDPARNEAAIPSPLPLSESLIVAFAPIAILIGLTVVIFVIGYVVFMKQEVRA